jgi:transcriptional regulator with XRE-family HTH domain
MPHPPSSRPPHPFGAIARQWRESAGLIPAAAARALEVDPSTISKIESGQRVPDDITFVERMGLLYGRPKREIDDAASLVLGRRVVLVPLNTRPAA